jgi:hypothetical protein
MACELIWRLRQVGLAAEDECELPLTQQQIADAMGITSVHANRVLHDLRERDLIWFHSGKLKLLKPDSLAKVGEFVPDHLGEGRPAPSRKDLHGPR